MQLALTAANFQQKAGVSTLRQRKRYLLAALAAVVVGCLLSPVTALIQQQLPPWPVAMTPDAWPLWFYLLTAVPLSIYLSVAIHEAGHVVAALALGYRFVLVTVGMVGLANEVGGLRLRRVGNDLLAMRGSTVVLTTVARHHRWRELVVLASGPLAQALFLTGLLWLNTHWQGQPLLPWVAVLLHTLVFLTLLGLGSSIFPLQVGMVATDGQHVLRLLRGGAAIERQLLIQRLTASVFFETAYAELEPGALTAACTPDDRSRSTYAANLLAAARALAQHDQAAALHHLNQVLAFVHAYPAMRQAAWPFLYAARYELAFTQCAVAARQWLSLVEQQEYSYLAVDYEQARLHLTATLLLAEGNPAAARHVAQQSLELLPRRLDHGCVASEQTLLAGLLRQTAQVQAPPPPPTRWLTRQTPRLLLQTGMSLVAFSCMCALF